MLSNRRNWSSWRMTAYRSRVRSIAFALQMLLHCSEPVGYSASPFCTGRTAQKRGLSQKSVTMKYRRCSAPTYPQMKQIYNAGRWDCVSDASMTIGCSFEQALLSVGISRLTPIVGSPSQIDQVFLLPVMTQAEPHE